MKDITNTVQYTLKKEIPIQSVNQILALLAWYAEHRERWSPFTVLRISV